MSPTAPPWLCRVGEEWMDGERSGDLGKTWERRREIRKSGASREEGKCK